jgi:hypothetical protein
MKVHVQSPVERCALHMSFERESSKPDLKCVSGARRVVEIGREVRLQ